MEDINKTEEESVIQDLLKPTYEHGYRLQFVDIVIAEAKDSNNYNYNVYWIGPNKDKVDKYRDQIETYFNEQNGVSMLHVGDHDELFLQLTESKGYREIIEMTDDKLNYHLDKDPQYSGLENIEDPEVKYLKLWKNIVLEPLEFKNVSFIRKEIIIGKKKFLAGVWLMIDDSNGVKEIIWNEIKLLSRELIHNYSLQILAKNAFDAIHEVSTKSAKSAIMGRNLSHNIGSHVIYYLRQHLNGDLNNLKDVLHNIKFEDADDTKKIKISLESDKNEENSENTELPKSNYIEVHKSDLDLAFLKGLGTFLAYLQERQDFIAALTSNYNPTYTSANFKSFVIDNFCKDLKAKRHSSNNDAKQEVNILLKYIAKSEDTNIHIKFNGHDLDDASALDKNLALHNYSVDLPGSTLGRQAIYSILENIIRNAAKHGKRKDGSNDLTLDISIAEIPINKDNEKWAQEFYQVKVTDNNDNPTNLDKKIRKSLQSDLIDANGRLIENEKGIKEILISALWLNGKSITDVSKEERLKYIDVQMEKDTERGINALSYVFYVKKSKKIVIINNDLFDKHKTHGLQEYGIIKKEDVLNNLDSLSRYNLVVDFENCFTEDKHDFEDNAERRPLKSDINKFRRYLNINDCKEEIEFTYEFFGKEALNDEDNLKELVNQYYAFLQDKTHLPRQSAQTTDQPIDIYIFLYHLYVIRNYYHDGKLPKIAFTVNDKSQENMHLGKGLRAHLRFYKNAFVDYNNNKSFIEYNNEIYYNNQLNTEGLTIAFRRHISSHIEEFFNEENKSINLKHKDASYFKEYLEKTKENYLSVESVTGDNSSYRILVNEEIDDLWTLKKLEATAAKVLIIDERLFDNNVYLQIGGLSKKQKDNIKELLKPFFKNPDLVLRNFDYNLSINQYDDITRKFYDQEEVNEHGIKLKNKDSNYTNDSLKLEEIQDNIGGIVCKVESTKSNIQKTILNKLRLIDIATLKSSNFINSFNEIICKVDYKNNKFSIIKENEQNLYDYISIHQGIIDKLYKLANPESQKDKKIFTRQIVGGLRSQYNAKKIVIHTGRGKPNYIKGIAPYRSLSDLDYALIEPKEVLLNYFESASFEI